MVQVERVVAQVVVEAGEGPAAGVRHLLLGSAGRRAAPPVVTA
jgi:hypothetical protein